MSPRTSPRAAPDDDCERLTLDEAAERLGISRERVRRMARRKRWAKLSGNDGLVRIGVPVDRLSRVLGQDPGRDPGPVPGSTLGHDPGQADAASAPESEPPELVLKVLERLSAAQGELVEMGKRLGAAEADVQTLKELVSRLDRDKQDLKSDRDAWKTQAESAQHLLTTSKESPTERQRRSWWPFRRAS